MSTINKNKIIINIIYISIWSCWLSFLALVSYKTRFWINQDTIGSLDTARYLINYEFLKAVNSYWGSGYGIFLSLLPLDNFNSWFFIHLLISLLIVLSQLFIYKGLRLYNISKNTSTLIVFFWGISHFVTGGAFFITADVPLCFMASLYVFIASHSKTDNNTLPSSRVLLLGILHAFASITKAIAFYGLMIYPILVFSRNLTHMEKGKAFKTFTFILYYLLSFILIMSFWCVGIKYKYGRFTFSDTASWNYSLFVDNSIASKEAIKRNEAIKRGEKRIPQYGTYWWSDIGVSLYDWNFKTKFNLKMQIECLYGNIIYFIKNDVKKDIFIKLILILSIIYLIVLTYKFRKKDINEKFLGFVGVSILLIYAQISLQIRFFPFVLLFLMPILAISIEKNRMFNNKIRITTTILVTIAIMHGILVMIMASVSAPNDAHFQIKNIILKNGYKNDNKAFIGAYLTNEYIDHHAIIAFLLKTKTAEISSNDNSLSNFTASFIPQYVLIETNRSNILNKLITVDGQYFKQLYTTLWEKGRNVSKLAIYEKISSVHKIPN